ncbi:helix-turn-helix domain-containing protein [Streptomyces sp. NPDC056485]|uniref:helix-turn-helix domain-containing protein n=1 Tax=Streptomyces sp. NPDC056485 TaxID=3345834 RepID=UPI0036B1F560
MSEAWRYGGNQIKLWRTEAGKSREELGEEAGYSAEYVKSMEQGRRQPTLHLLQVADSMFGARGKLAAAADYMKPDPHTTHPEEFMAAEVDCLDFQSYEPLYIPGLLQTEAYMRALLAQGCPPPDEETYEERVQIRLARQATRVRRVTARYGFIIYEAALRTGIGGVETMRQQLFHLLELPDARNVSVQVLPAHHATGPALKGSLIVMETPDHHMWAWAEGMGVRTMLTSPKKVSELRQMHSMIRVQALSTADTADYIKKVAEEL